MKKVKTDNLMKMLKTKKSIVIFVAVVAVLILVKYV
jgi:hypothetical protein